MAVDSVTGTTTGASGTTNALAKLGADSTLFLKLLTTQMQHQDPLDPMDTSDYTSQLVQFSQVEQSIQQSGTLKSILSALNSDNLVGAAAVVGKTASFGSDTAGLSATAPAQWTYAASRPAQTVTATITNALGVKMATIPLNTSTGEISWDGMLETGVRAPNGSYKLEIAAKDANGSGVPVSVSATGVVSEVAMDATGLSFQVNGAFYSGATLIRLAR